MRLAEIPARIYEEIMHRLPTTIQSKPDGFDACPVRLHVSHPVTNPTSTVSQIHITPATPVNSSLHALRKYFFASLECQSAALLNTFCVPGILGHRSRLSVRGSRWCRRVLRNRSCHYRLCGSLRTIETKSDYSCRSLRAAGTID